ASRRVDELQLEDEKEEREPGEAPPKRHRGKGQSPAEELLSATLDFWATSFQQCRREVEDEGDLEPPEEGELAAFIGVSLAEFRLGSLTMRLGIVRLWKHVFKHFAEERLPLKSQLSDELCGQLVAAVQDASWDARSERLRRPALELAAALAQDAVSGGREALLRGMQAEAKAAAGETEGAAALRAVQVTAWLDRCPHCELWCSCVRAKISALREKFAGFQSQWEEETRNRIDRDGSKLDGVKDSMSKLEGSLNGEIKRRVEANKALQSMFEVQITSIQDRLEGIFTDRLDRLQEGVDSLADRMSMVEQDFSLTREQYIQDIEDKNAVVAKDTNGMQNAFENEKIDRKERELAISRKLGDHEARTSAALEGQAQFREQKYQGLRSELDNIKRNRATGDDKFQTFILEEVAVMKNSLVAESHAREQ
ncbi:unnamed protein product, partial [Polarella glacialis]